MSLSSAFNGAVESEMKDLSSGIAAFWSGEHATTHGVHEHHEHEEHNHGGDSFANETSSVVGQVISEEVLVDGERHYEVAFNDDQGHTHTEMVPAGDMYPRRGDDVEVSWNDGQASMSEPDRDYER
jgi:hypothetical protein